MKLVTSTSTLWFGAAAASLVLGCGGSEIRPRPQASVPAARATGQRSAGESAPPRASAAIEAPTVVARDEPEPRPLRLCSWNVKKLGHGTTTDYAAVTRVLEENCDLAAIVEVMQRQGDHPGYDRLIQELGGAWSGSVTDSPRPNTSAGSAEFYAFVWRPSLVHLCDGWQGLRIFGDNDGGPNGTGDDHFAREPAFACFEAGPSGSGHGADFVVAAYHATWQSGRTRLIAEEVAHLPEVFEAMQAARPGEHDLLVVGDFNLRPADLAAAGAFQDRTEGAGSTLNASGEVTANLYDHFVTLDAGALSELASPAEVLDVRGVASSPAEFFASVSDHLPVRGVLETATDDD